MSNILNRLFFNKYRAKKLIATTLFSSVYEGIIEKQNEPIFMKFEDQTKNKLLENEAYLLYYLKGLGIPKIISYGKSGIFNILIEEMLGLTIYQIWKSKIFIKEHILKNISMIALQALERLEYIHSKNIIHRDIKPDNFIIGRKDPKLIYLIDFGFGHKYRNFITGKHIKYKFIKFAIGSPRYISINGIKGYEQSRRDDLESLGYMLIYLATKHLPWINIENLKINKANKIKEITKIKISTTPEMLCKGLPEEFAQYIKYCRNLTFEQDPDYNYLKSLFTNILIKIQQKNDLKFFWIFKTKIIHIKKKNEIYNLNTPQKNKESKHQRLYNKIKKSLEKKKSSKELKYIINLKKKNNSFNKNEKIKLLKTLNILNIKKKSENNNNQIKNYVSQSVRNSELELINNKEIYTNRTNTSKLENKIKNLNYSNNFTFYNINLNNLYELKDRFNNNNYNSLKENDYTINKLSKKNNLGNNYIKNFNDDFIDNKEFSIGKYNKYNYNSLNDIHNNKKLNKYSYKKINENIIKKKLKCNAFNKYSKSYSPNFKIKNYNRPFKFNNKNFEQYKSKINSFSSIDNISIDKNIKNLKPLNTLIYVPFYQRNKQCASDNKFQNIVKSINNLYSSQNQIYNNSYMFKNIISDKYKYKYNINEKNNIYDIEFNQRYNIKTISIPNIKKNKIKNNLDF